MTTDSSAAHGPQAALIAFAIRFRGVIVVLACLLLAYGGYSLEDAKYNVFPEFAPPQVGIQTEAPGLAAEQVEILVTRPLETALSGIPGVDALRSASIQGLSVVTVVFAAGSDVYRARQVVAERLALAAGQIPRGVAPPSITPLTSSTSTVLIVGLTSEKRSAMDVRSFADGTLARRLLSVQGVAQLSVFGGDVKSLQVQVRPDDLLRYAIGLDEVVAAARRATGVRGAGFVETANQRITLQTEGQSLSAAALARTVLRHDGGASLTLGDVADVAEAPKPAIGGALIQGRPGVMVMIGQQYGSNTVEVTKRIDAALKELRPALASSGITLDADLFRPANFIDTALGGVLFALALGGGFVVIVLFLFLFDWRTAAISSIAIPLSLLAAVLVLQWLGQTLNTMTLGGLAIAIGEVVDDAVIGVENVVRRLRENRRAEYPRPPARVVFDAILEVRGAVVYATFAVLLVVVPVLALSGVAGRLFAPLGIAYILAVLTSLVVALTLTPALSMMLLAHRQHEPQDPPLVRWSRGRYRSLLRWVEGRPQGVFLALIVLTVAAAAALPFFGATFLPDLKEGHFIAHTTAAPGTSIEESLRLGKRINDALLKVPGVRSVAQHVGRAEAGADTAGPHYSEFEIDLAPGLDGDAQEVAEADIRKVLASFPGVAVALRTFLGERVEETVSGFSAPVVVNIYGSDLDAIDRAANDVVRELGEVRGAAEVQLQSPPGLPQVTIHLRPDDLMRWGLDAVDVLDLVSTAYEGEVVGQTYQDNQAYDVIVTLDAATRGRVERIGDLPLRTPSGSYVTLRQIADIYLSSGRYQVLHQGGRRVQTVTANVVGRDLASFVAAAKVKLAREVPLPAGSYLEFAGSAEAQARSRRDLLLNSAAAGLGIVLMLSIITGHWRNLLLVLANMPFAFVGGVLAVFATGGLLSLGSMVGFVTLFGITLRNSIIMVSHFEHLVAEEGRRWNLETAIDGAADRLVPILMTSLVTALGLLPLALAMDEPGREIEGPMAVVILGGLFTSMALNLLVLPTLALHFGRFELPPDELEGHRALPHSADD
jgi:CzcA family heavy metal efflux pump